GVVWVCLVCGVVFCWGVLWCLVCCLGGVVGCFGVVCVVCLCCFGVFVGVCGGFFVGGGGGGACGCGCLCVWVGCWGGGWCVVGVWLLLGDFGFLLCVWCVGVVLVGVLGGVFLLFGVVVVFGFVWFWVVWGGWWCLVCCWFVWVLGGVLCVWVLGCVCGVCLGVCCFGVGGWGVLWLWVLFVFEECVGRGFGIF
ncbi:hypothetical protein RA267_27555, partial [Pseudomonas syringae pv. tagetis]|uniref:hypothetical protein n=1 Tax=Pseudomonas syringae group genomosp. 7 TaxID=251699 RepID=UPI00377031EC